LTVDSIMVWASWEPAYMRWNQPGTRFLCI